MEQEKNSKDGMPACSVRLRKDQWDDCDEYTEKLKLKSHNHFIRDAVDFYTGNILLSLMILVMYGISVLFYEKAKKVFFCIGLSSLSMFFAIMFSKFESWGRFANKCVGPYIGLIFISLTIVAYVWLNINDKQIK